MNAPVIHPVDPAALKRALVIKLRHHGDVLLAAPVLSALKRHAPQCEIDALVYADTAPMLSGHPALRQLHCIDRAWKKLGVAGQARAEWALLKSLEQCRYDLIVHLTVHTRGSWLARWLKPRWSVAPDVRDKRGAGFWRSSFTHLYPAQSHSYRHTVDTNLDSLRALGWPVDANDMRVILVPGADATAKVSGLLAQHGLAERPFIHLHPASRWQFKCWPAKRVAELCDALRQRGWPVVLTSAPDDKEKALVAEVLEAAQTSSSPDKHLPPLTDLSGQLTLKEMAALSARARLFVGVDSAPMHIAAAMDTPTIGIFGPSGDQEWGPWEQALAPVVRRHRVVASTVHRCRPCGRAGCDDSKVSECLVSLPLAPVLHACEELLR